MSGNRDGAPHHPALAVFSHGELMGDAMIKLPFLRALRAAFTDWRIVWICSETTQLQGAAAPFVRGYIDSFVAGSGWGDRPVDMLRRPPTTERFDLVIDTQGLWWRTLAARRIRHDVFISGCAGFYFSDRKPAAARCNPKHGLDRLLRLIEAAAGIEPPTPRLRDCVTPAGDLLEMAAQVLPDGPRYVALAPGAGKRGKCWPLENYVALAQAQLQAGRVPVFLLGPAELDWIGDLQAAVPGALFPLQTAATLTAAAGEPHYSPACTIAVARRCAAAVGADCGLTHILGVADIPLVSLFGPTSGAKVHPRVMAGVWLQAQDFGPGRDMGQIPLSAVADAVNTLLGEGTRS